MFLNELFFFGFFLVELPGVNASLVLSHMLCVLWVTLLHVDGLAACVFLLLVFQEGSETLGRPVERAKLEVDVVLGLLVDAFLNGLSFDKLQPSSAAAALVATITTRPMATIRRRHDTILLLWSGKRSLPALGRR